MVTAGANKKMFKDRKDVSFFAASAGWPDDVSLNVINY